MDFQQQAALSSTPTIQISWGELIDKITILEIKAQRLRSNNSAANLHNELAALMSIAHDALSKRHELASLKNQLKSVNEALWEIEDGFVVDATNSSLTLAKIIRPMFAAG